MDWLQQIETLRQRRRDALAASVLARRRTNELIQETVDVLRMLDQVQHSPAIPKARLNDHPFQGNSSRR